MVFFFYGLIGVPVGEDGPVQRSASGLEEGQSHLVLGDLRVDKAPERGRLTGEELHSSFRNLVPVTHVRVQEVASAAHHVTHTGLFNVLRRTERVGPEADLRSYRRFWTRAGPYLQVVVVAAQVSCGVVLDEQRVELLQQTGRGPVLRHRPHGVVARHQQEVGLGASQSLLQPGQLPLGIGRVQRSPGLLV